MKNEQREERQENQTKQESNPPNKQSVSFHCISLLPVVTARTVTPTTVKYLFH